MRPFRSPLDFIARHEVFTLAEYRAAYRSLGRNPAGAHDNLAYHVRVGNLLPLRRGLYARPGGVDHLVLASKLTDDGIISHEGALAFHGLVHVEHQVSFLTRRRIAEFHFNEVIFKPMTVKPRRYARHAFTTEERGATTLRVSTIEQALVDCLDDLDRAPRTAVELLATFRESRERVKVHHLIAAATERSSPLLVSRVGYFLQRTHPELADAELRALERKALPAPDYFVRKDRRSTDQLVSRWNLIVPRSLANAK